MFQSKSEVITIEQKLKPYDLEESDLISSIPTRLENVFVVAPTSQPQEEALMLGENPQNGSNIQPNQLDEDASTDIVALFEQQVNNIAKCGQKFSCAICRYCFTSREELNSHKARLIFQHSFVIPL